jgi:hypothetical protein
MKNHTAITLPSVRRKPHLSTRLMAFAFLTAFFATLPLRAATAAIIGNGDFETPNVGSGGTQYNPQYDPAAGQPWFFSSLSGIAASGGTFVASGPTTGQFAFLQHNANGSGSIQQTIHFDSPGTYTLTYDDAGRAATATAFGDLEYRVNIFSVTNGAQVLQADMFSTSTASSQPFTHRTLQFIVPAAGDYALQIGASTGKNSDDTAFFDNMVITLSSDTPGCKNPPPGLVSWYRAENDAKDQQGNNDASIQGSPGAVAFTTGKVGQAFSFNGTDGYVTVPNSPNLIITGGSPFTIDAWIRRDTASSGVQQVFVEKRSTDGLNYISVQISPSGQLVVYLTGHQYPYSGPVVPADGQWHFIGMLYDAKQSAYDNASHMTLFVDGEIATYGNYDTGSANNDGPLTIGAARDSNGAVVAPFKGQIDELEFFSGGLTNFEVQSVYAANSSGKCLPPPAPVEPDLQDASDSGESNTDNYTNVTSAAFTVAGLVNGATVDLLRNLQVVASVTASGPSMTLSDSGLTDNTYSYTAQQTVNGLTSKLSTALSVTIDTTPPVAPTAPDLQAASDSGSSNTDNLTNLSPISFDIGNTENGATVKLYRDGLLVAPTTGNNGTVSITDGSSLQDGSYNYSATVVDRAGNTTSSAGGLTVTIDRTPPVITVPANITAEATGPNGASVTFSPTGSDAHDGSVTVVSSPASGSTFPLGTTTVTTSATDLAGNPATQKTFTVTVRDTTPPTISNVPADIFAEATAADGAAVSYAQPTANDLVDGAVAVTCNPSSGSTFGLGTAKVTCSATDARGNTASKSFNVTVRDTTPPTFSNVPTNIVTEATGPGGAAVSYTPPAAHDTVSGEVSVACSPASGSTFALGSTTVTCTATDGASNTGTASFSVTVRDTVPPVITVPPDVVVYNEAGQDGAHVTFAVSAADAVSGNVTATPSKASGSLFSTGTTMVTVTAADAAGNTATKTFLVTVRKTELGNISTRVPVGKGDNNAGIGGFIIRGNDARAIVVRALGPSLNVNGVPVPNQLQDPVVEIFDNTNKSVAKNDNWQDASNAADVSKLGLAPSDPKEAAILIVLPPGEYTAVVTGAGGSTGNALVEVFALVSSSDSDLGNISTRGQVQTGDNVLIGGVIVKGGDPRKILFRAIGPELTDRNVANALEDPTIDLRDANGDRILFNDNWQDTQKTEIEDSKLAPTDSREAAIVKTLGAGNYTAIVRGKAEATGIALVEAYNLP